MLEFGTSVKANRCEGGSTDLSKIWWNQMLEFEQFLIFVFFSGQNEKTRSDLDLDPLPPDWSICLFFLCKISSLRTISEFTLSFNKRVFRIKIEYNRQ
ncbi:unnamed protein product [Arabis nemorensis]|uniref:Uncharacterized protein n=1 Tax=Arabis nemorensis TaxID=586526 RepID=A0A565BCK3_9BRAS|nr:unnamed protein product [Arabis nemorensis]